MAGVFLDTKGYPSAVAEWSDPRVWWKFFRAYRDGTLLEFKLSKLSVSMLTRLDGKLVFTYVLNKEEANLSSEVCGWGECELDLSFFCSY